MLMIKMPLMDSYSNLKIIISKRIEFLLLDPGHFLGLHLKNKKITVSLVEIDLLVLLMIIK